MRQAVRYAEQISYSSKETLELTRDIAEKCKHLSGVFVECGVAAGAQVIIMADMCPNKIIYAFDSFKGIPLPSNRDDQMPGIKMLSRFEQSQLPDPGKQLLQTSGAVVVSVEQFQINLQIAEVNADNIVVVPGWFEETVSFYKDGLGAIALLRLDGDLYNSTKVCLENLFPLVVAGGFVIIDDWALPGCRAACNDYFSSVQYEPDYKFLKGQDYTIAYFQV